VTQKLHELFSKAYTQSKHPSLSLQETVSARPRQHVGYWMNRNKKIYLLFLIGILWGCGVSSQGKATEWKTYTNSRYAYEFFYPSNWKSLEAPVNDDGIAFVSPQNNNIEIRGWASNQLPETIIETTGIKTTTNPNFKTAQGISGVLTIEADGQETRMKLTLAKDKIGYYWQGRCPSGEIDNYYRFFYYIAQQYKIKR